MRMEPSFRCRPWWFLVAAGWVPCVAREQPWIALGLAGNLNADNAVVHQAVASWLDVGGRAVDAALMYYNDEGLRQGLEDFYGRDPRDPSEPSVASDEVFVTTKIPPEQMGFDGTLEAILEAREKILPAGRHGAVNMLNHVDRSTVLVLQQFNNVQQFLSDTFIIYSHLFGWKSIAKLGFFSFFRPLRSSKLDCVLIHWPGRAWRKRRSDPSCVVDRGEAAADWSVCRRESWAALRHAQAMGMVGLRLGKTSNIWGNQWGKYQKITALPNKMQFYSKDWCVQL